MNSFQEMKSKIDDYYPLYINGEWVAGEADARLDVFCPANGERLCSVAIASANDVDRAVKAAQAAFPKWRALPLSQCYETVMAVYRQMRESLEQLSIAEALETGHPVPACRSMIASAVEGFPYFAGLLRTHEDGTNSEVPGVRVMVIREPVGVVGAICAWNLPLLLNLWKLAPALAAGNCIVLKPSSFTPIGTMELLKAIGGLLPPGVLNVVNGKGSKAGQYLLDHPGLNKLSFTGSTEVGISVGVAAAQRVIPATLELGGKSAGIYFNDIPPADMPKAIQTIVSNCISHSGQVCSMQSRVLVEEGLYDTLVEEVAKALQGVKIGPPWLAGSQMGPVAHESHLNSILEYVDIGQKEGARLVTGGIRLTEGDLAQGFYVAPTIFADVDNSMRIAQEEIFGPVICFIKFKGEEEAIRIANDSIYGLSGGVFTGDLRKGLRVAEGVRAGSIKVNNASSRSMGGSAFGGYKASGIGRECYKTTLDAFSQIKMIAF